MKKIFISLLCIFTACTALFSFGGCDTTVDYSQYVSEYRSEIYIAEQNGYSLSAFFCAREYPYRSDGVCAEKQQTVEVYLTVPDNTKNYGITFTLDGKECGGDMSYDSVHTRFFFSQSAESVPNSTIDFKICFDEESVTLQAKRMREGNELSMPEIIAKLAEARAELFKSMTSGKTFTGELYVRLVYNEKCYYFVAVSTDKGMERCFLLDAQTGEILAERKISAQK